MSDPTPGPCLVCAAQRPRLLYSLSEFDIAICTKCGQIYLDPLPSAEKIREVFQLLYTRGEGSVPELKTYFEHCYEDELAVARPFLQPG